MGKAHFIVGEPDCPPETGRVAAEEVVTEIERFLQTVKEVGDELEQAATLLEEQKALEQAQIVRVHIAALGDPSFHKKVTRKISKLHLKAEQAIESILQELVGFLKGSGNALIAERAADFTDVEQRLKRKLRGCETPAEGASQPPHSRIVFVPELLPSYIFEAPEKGVIGFVVTHGTRFSHSIILARLNGIPVLKFPRLPEVKSETAVLLDALGGQLLVEPERKEVFEILVASGEEEGATGQELAVALWLNVVDPRQIEPRRLGLSAGVGLFRTEVLFMREYEDFPTEERQYDVYRSLFDRCTGKSVTIRTLDIGGDKSLSYFSPGPEDNPFLGLRAHRIYHHHPEILRTQLRAILRAGQEAAELRILYPMIETYDSLRFVQSMYEEVVAELGSQGMHFDHVRQGVLIEVPSAVWAFSQFMQHLDFASLGTNDMLQYLFAADRNNANVSRYYEPEQPVFLQILRQLAVQADALGKPLSICGEIASSLRMLPLLVGLGYHHLSIDAHTLLAHRRYLASVDIEACRQLAENCLAANTALEVHGLLDAFHPEGALEHSGEQRSLGETQALDPVCHMIVSTQHNPFTLHDGETTHYFCSRRCRRRFMNQKQISSAEHHHLKE